MDVVPAAVLAVVPVAAMEVPVEPVAALNAGSVDIILYHLTLLTYFP